MSWAVFVALACLPYHAQAFFKTKTKTIELSGHRLEVEIADTEEKRAQGLMYRDHLAEGHGMLFIFDQPQPLTFWMKDTRIPLSIAFFDQHRVLLNRLDMSVPAKGTREADLRRYSSRGSAKYALETPLGWFQNNNVKEGSLFKEVEKK